MHHTVQMVTLVRKEFIQPFPVETFHRPPDALFEGFRIFPRRGKCWTYLGKSPKKVLKLNLAVEMVVWRYNFVIGKIKLSMLKRCRGEVVWTNSMTWILTRSHWSCAIDDDDVSDHKQEINLSQGSTRTICTVWYSVFFGGLAFMSPEKNLDAKFCIHNVVWSLFRPSDSLKLHKYFFQQSWICAFKCAIDWTPQHMTNWAKEFPRSIQVSVLTGGATCNIRPF